MESAIAFFWEMLLATDCQGEVNQVLRKLSSRVPSRRREDVVTGVRRRVAVHASFLILCVVGLAEPACTMADGILQSTADLRMRAYAVDREDLSFDAITGAPLAVDLIE